MAGVCVNVAFYGMWRTLALLGRAPGGGPARLVPLRAGEQVKGERERLPAEQKGKRVLRGHDHRDRAERQRIARTEPTRGGHPPDPPATGGILLPPDRPSPAGERDRDRYARAEGQRQEHPGQPVSGQRGHRLARHRVAEPAGDIELDRSAGQGEPAQYGQACRARRAKQVQGPGRQGPAADEVGYGGQSQQDQARREQPAHSVLPLASGPLSRRRLPSSLVPRAWGGSGGKSPVQTALRPFGSRRVPAPFPPPGSLPTAISGMVR